MTFKARRLQERSEFFGGVALVHDNSGGMDVDIRRSIIFMCFWPLLSTCLSTGPAFGEPQSAVVSQQVISRFARTWTANVNLRTIGKAPDSFVIGANPQVVRRVAQTSSQAGQVNLTGIYELTSPTEIKITWNISAPENPSMCRIQTIGPSDLLLCSNGITLFPTK